MAGAFSDSNATSTVNGNQSLMASVSVDNGALTEPLTGEPRVESSNVVGNGGRSRESGNSVADNANVAAARGSTDDSGQVLPMQPEHTKPRKRSSRRSKKIKKLSWHEQKKARQNLRRVPFRDNEEQASSSQANGESPVDQSNSSELEQIINETPAAPEVASQPVVRQNISRPLIQEVIAVQELDQEFGGACGQDEDNDQVQRRETLSSPVDDDNPRNNRVESGYYIYGPTELSRDEYIRMNVEWDDDGIETVTIDLLSVRILPRLRYGENGSAAPPITRHIREANQRPLGIGIQLIVSN
uniref:uncharacterized protein LOC120334010 isoform X1 n=1 Tax=Styela clava TaxID=7725 RepID=UPI00193A5B48|nr:uncharacterized protein LOC120334010 isoform X1 [Styela clava]